MHRHFALFKPYGYISQFKKDPNKKSRKTLGELYDFPELTMSIGRLDADSEGLLLLTTDGKESYRITSTGVEKEYYVQVDGQITQDAIEQLKQGVQISVEGTKYMTKTCRARLLDNPPILPERAKKIRDERHGPTSWISITLTEGKYRQVRKMTAVIGFPTLRLVRYRIANNTIDGMKAGEVKEIFFNS